MDHIITPATLALTDALEAAVAADALDRPTPCTEWNVGQVLQHAALDQQIWAAGIAGTDQPGGDAFHPQGLSPEATRELVAEATDQANRAWSRISDDMQQVATPLPQGPMPVRTAAALAALDAAVHAWDVTVSLDAPSSITETDAYEMLNAARTVVEPLRAYGVYGEALPPEPADGYRELLLRYLGRDPNWRR